MRTRALVVLLIAGVAGAQVGVAAETTYGDGVTLSDSVAISTLLTEPGDYLGEKVRVEGVVTGVCAKRGCWMQVTDPDSGDGIRIKVEDGVIVFPLEAKGHRAVAEGVFEAVRPPSAAKTGEHRHEHGEGCDKEQASQSDCASHDDVRYRIRGTGAVISS